MPLLRILRRQSGARRRNGKVANVAIPLAGITGKIRKPEFLRQNLYLLACSPSHVGTLTNARRISPRESHRILNNDEFVETFELAAPGKEFEVYAENRFRRKK